MTFSGTFKAVKDYVQPMIRTAALALPLFVAFTGKQRIALLVGLVYLPLHLLSSYAARHSDAFARLAGSESGAARRLWWLNLSAFAVLTAGVALGWTAAGILAFVVLAVLEDLWRPILVGRFADRGKAGKMATVLSIESQARSLFAAALAPALGLAVDLAGRFAGHGLRFLPVGVGGLGIAAIMLATGRAAAGRQEPPASGDAA
jgi:hypothetical protein